MRLEPIEAPGLARRAGYPLAALLATALVAALLAAVAGGNPLAVLGQIVDGAVGSKFARLETLNRATPLIFTGLAVAVAFRAKLWNIGAEAQLYLGAVVTVLIGTKAGLPAPVLLPLMAMGAILAGALMLLGPTLLKTRLGVDEVVTTLLLNFIVLLFVSLAIEGFLRDTLAFGWPQSVPVVEDAMLPQIVPRSRLHLGLVIAVLAALAVFFLNRATVFGLQSRAAGLNAAAARFSGVPIGRTLLLVACLSGGLAGLAGAVEVLGVKGYVSTDLSPGFGYSGIVVAMLAALNPIGVIFAALFVATMFVGADGMSRALEVPSFIADVTVSLALLTMLVALFFTSYRVRR